MLVRSSPWHPPTLAGMERFGFESWLERDQDEQLRNAWMASEQLKLHCNWDHLPGTCVLCGASAGFSLAKGANRSQPDVRESLVCIACGHNARVRAGLSLLRDHLPAGDSVPRVYLTEQVTPTFLWLQRHLRADLSGSEFQPDKKRLAALTRSFQKAGGTGEVQFQDVTRLGFSDASLDAITTFDVLEHVPDYQAAISEFARTLRPGGALIATFPFTDGPDTLVRARMESDGTVTHLLEPEYHGDPISGGVLCFYHFGWDVLQACRAAGFRSVRMVMPWGHEHGLLYGLWTLIAIR